MDKTNNISDINTQIVDQLHTAFGAVEKALDVLKTERATLTDLPAYSGLYDIRASLICAHDYHKKLVTPPKHYNVTINGEQQKVYSRFLSYEEIVARAGFGIYDPGLAPKYTCTWTNAKSFGPRTMYQGILTKFESIELFNNNNAIINVMNTSNA